MASLTQVRRYEYQQSFKDAGFTAGMKAAGDAARKMAADTAGAGEAVGKVTQETQRAAPSWQAVNRLIDGNASVAAASEKANRTLEARIRSLREESLRNADVAARAGQIEKDLTALRDAAIRKATELAAAQGRLNASATSSGGALTAMKGQLQNVGFQLQDIAVQAQMGTNALTILGQQGPQLLGGFGPAGAIAGAVISVGALVAGIIGLSEKSLTLADATKAVGDNYSRLNDAATARITAIRDEAAAVETLRGGYVAMGEAGRKAEQLAQRTAFGNLNDQASKAVNQLGGSFGGRLDTQQQGSQVFDPLGNATGAFTGAGTGPKLAADTAAAVEAFRQLRDVTGPTVDGLRSYIAALDDAAKIGGASTAEIRNLREAAIAQLPAFTDLEAAYRKAQVQSVAMRLASGESAEAIIASSAAAQGSSSRFAVLTGEIVRTAAALNQLRKNAADDPLAGVNAEASRLADRLAALNAGGKEALDRVVSQQEQQIATQARVNRVYEDFIATRVKLGDTEEAAIAKADAEKPKWEQAIGAVLNLNTQLVVRTREVETARQDADKARTAAEAAAKRAATAEDAAGKKALDNANKLQSSWDKLWADADKKAEDRVAKSKTAEDGQAQSLERLRLETKLVGESTATRDREVAVLTERQKILTENGGTEAALLTESSQRRLANAGAIADETSALNKQRSVMQELGSIGERAFQTIGDAITTAFVQGKGAAVNFANVAKAALAQIIAEIAKLAILRPIMNAVLGTDYATISNIGGSLGSSLGNASAAGSSSGGFGLGSLSSLGSYASQAGSYLGLTGQGGMLSGVGSSLSGYTGLLGGANSVAAPSLAGMSTSEAMASLPSGVTSATSGVGMSAMSGAAGGIGLGMLGGSIVGGARGSVDTTQNALIGSIAGAALGFMVAGPVGALIGGALGGTASGFFGPTKKGMAERSGGDVAYGNANGQLQIIGGGGKRWDSAAAFAEVQAQLDKINAAISQRGLTLTGGTGMVGFGQASKNPTSVNTDIGGMLSSSDANVQGVIDRRGGKTIEELFGDIDFVQQVYNPLTKTAVATTDFQKQMDALAAQFVPVIDRAASLGLATDELTVKWTDAIDKVNKAALEQAAGITVGLVGKNARLKSGGSSLWADLLDVQTSAPAERRALQSQLENLGLSFGQVAAHLAVFDENLALTIETITSQAWTSFGQKQAGFLARGERARGNDMGADLLQFDNQTASERADYAATLRSLGVSQQDFLDNMTMFENTVGQERLNIIKDYGDKIMEAEQARAGKAANIISSLADYATGLRTSDKSPLSVTEQYFGASSSFNALLGKAQGGDGDAMAKLSQSADTFLSASRAVYGSGTGYATDFSRVVDAIGAIAAQSPDQLTAAIYATEMRTQTQILTDELVRLRGEVTALRTEVRLNGATPGSVAA